MIVNIFSLKFQAGRLLTEVTRYSSNHVAEGRHRQSMLPTPGFDLPELVEVNGETNHIRLLVHDPPKRSVSSLVNTSKVYPADCFGRSDPILPSDTGKMLYGHHRISLHHAVEHPSAFSRNTSSSNANPFNAPYIPVLKGEVLRRVG